MRFQHDPNKSETTCAPAAPSPPAGRLQTTNHRRRGSGSRPRPIRWPRGRRRSQRSFARPWSSSRPRPRAHTTSSSPWAASAPGAHAQCLWPASPRCARQPPWPGRRARLPQARGRRRQPPAPARANQFALPGVVALFSARARPAMSCLTPRVTPSLPEPPHPPYNKRLPRTGPEVLMLNTRRSARGHVSIESRISYHTV